MSSAVAWATGYMSAAGAVLSDRLPIVWPGKLHLHNGALSTSPESKYQTRSTMISLNSSVNEYSFRRMIYPNQFWRDNHLTVLSSKHVFGHVCHVLKALKSCIEID